MSTHTYLHHGLSILQARIKTPRNGSAIPFQANIHSFLTLSHETCAGATTLGRQLVPLLDKQLGEEGRSWMFLDQDLIIHALKASQLPEQLSAYLPEDRLPEIQGLIGEMVGLHPSLWELDHQVAEAIHKLASLGSVILSGRAAHLITRDLPGGFHVRLIAPLEARIHRAEQMRSCNRIAAMKFLDESDQARQRYVQMHFEEDVRDPHAYDLVINTGRITRQETTQLVLRGMLDRMASLVPAG